MGRNIDTNVVEMQFDNAKFERNVKESMSTLEKLKSTLNFSNSAKSLSDLQTASDKLNFSGLSDGIQTVTARFSALQVIGMTVIQNLTNSAISAAKNIANSLTESIMVGGKNRALNIQNAKFQIEGLLGTEEFEKQWARIDEAINYAVKDTAYAYDSAARAASQFMASNVAVGEQLDTSLRAISGVAAMTNSTYDDIANVFTRVAGQGRVMAIDLNSLAARGMNAAATLANYLGITESEVRDLVSKGQISFELFSAAMDEAFGEHAKKGNETFEGALSNMKAALARIGAKMWDPLLTDQRDVFNQIRLLINDLNNNYLDKPINALNSKLGSAFDELVDFFELGGAKNIVLGIGDILNYAASTAKPVTEAFSNIFPKKSIKQIVDATDAFKKFTSTLELSENTIDKIKRNFEGLFAVLDIMRMIFKGGFEAALIVFNSAFDDANKNIFDFTANIGDNIVKLRDWLAEGDKITSVFTRVADAISRAISTIKDWIRGFTNLDTTKDFISNLGDVFSTFGNAIKELLGIDGTANFTSGINAIFEVAKKIVTFMLEQGGTARTLTTFALFSAAIYRLIQVFKNLQFFVGHLSTIAKGFANPIRFLTNTIQSAKTIKVAQFVALAVAVRILVSAIGEIVEIPWSQLVKGIIIIGVLIAAMIGTVKIIGNLNAQLKGVKLGKIGVLFIAMAASVWILVSALKTLDDIDLDWAFATKLFILVALLGVLTGALILISKFAPKISGSATFIIAIAAAVWIMAQAFVSLDGISTKGIWSGILIMAVITALMIAIIAASKLAGKAIKSAILIISFAVSVFLISLAFKILDGISDEGLIKGIIAVLVMTILMIAIIAASKLAGKAIKSAILIISFSISIGLMAIAFRVIDGLSPEGIMKGIIVFSFVTILMIAIIAASKLAGKAIKSAILMLAFANSMVIFAVAFSILDSISSEGMIRGLTIITVLTVIMVGVIVASKLAGKAIASAILMLSFAYSIKLLADAMRVLAELSWKELGKGLVAVIALSAIILAFSFISKYTGGTLSAMLTVLAFSAAISIISGVLIALAGVDQNGLKNATLSIMGIMTVMALLSLVLGTTKIPVLSTVSLLMMAAVIAVLALILGILIDDCKNIDKAIIAAEALGILIVALSVSLLLVSSAGLISVKALGALAVMVLVVGALAIILGLFLSHSQNIDKVMIVSMALSTLLLSMTAALTILSVVGLIAAAALPGVLLLMAFVIGFGAFALLIGEVINDDALKKINRGIEIMTQVAEGLGNLIGVFLGGIITGFASALSGLEQIGNELSGFMDSLQPFLEGASAIDPSVLNNVLTITDVIVELTKANVLDGITRLFSKKSALENFGDQLIPFGDDLMEFAKKIDGIKDHYSDINSASIAVRSLGSLMSSLPKDSTRLSEFSSGLGTFADGLISYKDTISGISESMIVADSETAAKAAQYIVELADTIPNSGGILGALVGENDLSGFSANLEAFGQGFVDYAKVIDGISNTNIVNDSQIAADAASNIVDLANNLKNEDGWIQKIFGGGNFDDFIDDMPAFGEALMSYAESIKGMSSYSSAMAIANGAIRTLAALGDIKNLSDFGKKIKTFSEDAVEFASTFSQVQIDDRFGYKLNAFCNTIQKLVELNLEENFTILASEAASSFEQLLNAIPEIGTDYSSVIISALEDGLLKASEYQQSFNNAGKLLVDSLNTGFKDNFSLQNSIDSVLNSMVLSFYYNRPAYFYKAAAYIATAIINGFNSISIPIKFYNVISNAISYIRGRYDGFYGAGQYFVIGIANGIDSYRSTASSAGTRLASYIINATKKAFDEHSPSKVGYRIGAFFGQGTINGVIKKADDAADAGTYLGESTISGLEMALRTASDLIENGIDSQPTIRPILDLSDVEEGTKSIYSSFGKNVSLNLSTTKLNALSISTDHSALRNSDSKNQNGTSGNVYNYTQNNYSPKALSRFDIYRQTKNQLAAMERVTKR